MHSVPRLWRVVLALLVALSGSVPAWGQLIWSRDFDSGTLLDGTGIPMIPYDPFYNVVGAHEFWQSFGAGSLRMGFNGLHDDSDSGLLIDPRPIAGDTSALLLLRYSTNPLLATTPGSSELNAGWVLRVNLTSLNGYVCVLDDRGLLQLQRLTGGEISDLCERENAYKNVPEFDPTQDWWLRFELETQEDGSLRIQARAWLDGTAEPPCEWQVQCSDENPLPAGPPALVANEDKNLAANFIDVDNASIASRKACLELCDNASDDDADGLVDCADPDCDASATCACHDPFADMNGDGYVDQNDFAVFQRCYTSEGNPSGAYDRLHCGCLDRDEMTQDSQYSRALDGDGDVDVTDLLKFIACATGPMIQADSTCDDVNQ